VKPAVPLNPVLARELRARGRRKSVPFFVAIFLAILIGIAANVWRTDANSFRALGSGSEEEFIRLTAVGRTMFEWSVGALFALIAFMVPGFTAASITGERDRQTLIPMQVSLLRPRQIVFGKMLSSTSYTLFLLVMAIPVIALGYAIGGVSIGEVIRAIVGLLAVGCFWAALSMLASSLVRRTGPAVVLAYAFMLIFLILTLIMGGILSNKGVYWANPFVGLCDFVVQGDPSNRSFGLFGGGPISSTAYSFVEESPRYWIRGAIMMGVLSVGCVWFAVRQISTPARSDR
jgi:ABC-type transport system involved in multi-copper enzyme maturation permease subunit